MESETKTTNIINTITPLEALFKDKQILIAGDVIAPLFSCAHVATYIGDQNARRYAKEAPAGHIVKCVNGAISVDGRGNNFFTESGLYMYLMRRNLPKAREFQDYVLKLLCTERRRLVDDATLRAKIAEDKIALVADELRITNEALSTISVQFRELQDAKATLELEYWTKCAESDYDRDSLDATIEALSEHLIRREIARRIVALRVLPIKRRALMDQSGDIIATYASELCEFSRAGAISVDELEGEISDILDNVCECL
jgi:prophage antirepressor-like protein